MHNTECLRIADQLRRAFEGKAWHGYALRELLAGVTAEQAAARPVDSAHSIWEITLHIEIWAHGAIESTKGAPLPNLYGTERDWPAATDHSPAAWADSQETLFRTGEQLVQTIEGFSDDRLTEIVPGRKYDFYYLFHGIVQHSLYHGGQIALLKKAAISSRASHAL